ncbi:MAG: hypothetical protein AAF483_10870 [Planctomycetota bacterium]
MDMQLIRNEDVAFAASSLHVCGGKVWARLLNGKIFTFSPTDSEIQKPLGNSRTSDVFWIEDKALLLLHTGVVVELDLVTLKKKKLFDPGGLLLPPIAFWTKDVSVCCVMGAKIRCIDHVGDCSETLAPGFEPELMYTCRDETLIAAQREVVFFEANTTRPRRVIREKNVFTSISEHPSQGLVALTNGNIYVVTTDGNPVATCHGHFRKSAFASSKQSLYSTTYLESASDTPEFTEGTLGEFQHIKLTACSSILPPLVEGREGLWVSHNAKLLLYQE